jgi:hypothetical protein
MGKQTVEEPRFDQITFLLWVRPEASPDDAPLHPQTQHPQEAKTGTAAVDAAEVKLYCQVPAITKLDSSLGTLTNCEYVHIHLYSDV